MARISSADLKHIKQKQNYTPLTLVLNLEGQVPPHAYSHLIIEQHVSGDSQLSGIFGRYKLGILILQVLFCDPTGHGTTPSDIDGDFLVNDLWH